MTTHFPWSNTDILGETKDKIEESDGYGEFVSFGVGGLMICYELRAKGTTVSLSKQTPLLIRSQGEGSQPKNGDYQTNGKSNLTKEINSLLFNATCKRGTWPETCHFDLKIEKRQGQTQSKQRSDIK